MSTKRVASLKSKPKADTGSLDYDIADDVQADTPEALKALADGTRLAILDLLLERAATTSQVSAALGKPKGTVGYHLKVLEKCGLVRIVRTRQVRALTEKYYGRTGRTIIISSPGTMHDPLFIVRDVLSDVQIVEGDALPVFTARRARIPESKALEYASLLASLAAEFASEPRAGERTYGFVAGVFPTGLPALRPEDDT
jgi:DNA-binding transcriptional ArsR family regulator